MQAITYFKELMSESISEQGQTCHILSSEVTCYLPVWLSGHSVNYGGYLRTEYFNGLTGDILKKPIVNEDFDISPEKILLLRGNDYIPYMEWFNLLPEEEKPDFIRFGTIKLEKGTRYYTNANQDTLFKLIAVDHIPDSIFPIDFLDYPRRTTKP